MKVGADIPRAPTTVSVGPDIAGVPTTVSALRRKVQHGIGVDSIADTYEQDEDKMEESNIDHNQIHIPVCNALG